jgi:hypothetical protein
MLIRAVPLYPFLLAQGPGSEHVGQALRFCLSDLIKIKVVPARTRTASLQSALRHPTMRVHTQMRNVGRQERSWKISCDG